MKKRIFTLLLATLILTSCGSGTTTSETNSKDTPAKTEPVQTEPEILEPELPDKKWDGAEFTLYTQSAYVLKEQTGEVYEDAVYDRTIALEEKFDIVFNNVITDDAYGNAPINDILAGDDTYELMAGHARVMTTYSVQNLAYNWYEMPYLQLDNPWWDQNMLDTMAVNKKIYMVPDDFTIGALSETKCFIINKDMFVEAGLELPYEAVLNGTWTFDMMKEMVSKLTRDLNGDGVYDLENDQIGCGISGWGAPINVLWTAGQKIVDTTGAGGRLEYVVNNETTVDVYDNYLNWLAEEPGAFNDAEGGGSPCRRAFLAGHVAFVEGWLGLITWARDMDADVGLIPYPKFYEDQTRYYTGVDAGCRGLVIPITNNNKEMSSAVMEYWMFLQDRDVVPVYFETVCKTKAARDQETALILDLIRDSRLYDFGYFHNSLSLNSIGRDLVLGNIGFATYYAERAEKAQAELDAVNAMYFND